MVGGLEGREFDLDEEEAAVGAVEDVELGGEAAVEGDAVAGFADEPAVALVAEVGVAVGREEEFFLAVLDGGGVGAHVFLDGEPIGVARTADAEGGRSAEVALLDIDMRVGVEVVGQGVDEVFALDFHFFRR